MFNPSGHCGKRNKLDEWKERKNWFNDDIKEKGTRIKNKVVDSQRTNQSEKKIDAQSQITQVIYNFIRSRTCSNRE